MGIINADDLARIPVDPPRRPDLLQGLQLSRSASKRALAFPLALIAFMTLMPLLVFSQDRDAQLALRETERASSRVESAEVSRRCGGAGTDISYSFTSHDGLAFRGRASACSQSPYAHVQPGDSIPIVYLKADPAVSAIAGQNNSNPAFFIPFLLFPLVGLVFFVPLFWPRFAQLRRDRKLFRIGSLAHGRVIFVSRQHESFWPGWPMPIRGEVYVAARLRSGEEREVKAICTNDWLLAHLPPDSEVNICVQGKQAVLLENYLR